MDTVNRPRLSVSTWSLHRSLGKPVIYGPEAGDNPPFATTIAPALTLLEVPARIAAAGIHTLEICHFHLASREPAYLRQVRDAITDAGVELWSLLIDGGDLSHPDNHARDAAWAQGWLDVAAQLGAKNARVSGGKQQPSAAAIARSEQNFARLAEAAEAHGLRLMTENWQNLLSTPEVVLTVLDKLEGRVGLCADFGNWQGPQKYADLAQIMARAESCHAKAHFSGPGQMDEADFVKCLELTKAVNFAGPYTLIYDGPDADEFAGLRLESAAVQPYTVN